MEQGPIHVWRWQVSEWLPQLAELEALLDDAERNRAGRFRFEPDREKYIVAHGLLRRALSKCVERPADQLRFDCGEHGKPFLRDSRGWEFNLSHAGDWVLAAACAEAAVGVDVECARRPLEVMQLAERFFSAPEAAMLRTFREEEREMAFFRYWCRKEASVKATGLGIAAGLQSFTVPLPAELVEEWHPIVNWWVRDLDVDQDCPAALAVVGDRRPVRFQSADSLWPLP